MTTTRTGYVPQGRWADGNPPEFWDMMPERLHPTEQSANQYLREVMEYRLAHPRAGQRVLAETRVIKRTIIDEVQGEGGG